MKNVTMHNSTFIKIHFQLGQSANVFRKSILTYDIHAGMMEDG